MVLLGERGSGTVTWEREKETTTGAIQSIVTEEWRRLRGGKERGGERSQHTSAKRERQKKGLLVNARFGWTLKNLI